MQRILKLLVSISSSFAAGMIGNLATIPNIPAWYATLEKPFFNPPNWVFGPVWTLLYLLVGISAYLVWTSSIKGEKRKPARLFIIQLVLNALWSIVFFGLHQPWFAAVIIVVLLIAIILTMRAFDRFSHLAMLLLIPYASWVCFAMVLNISIAILN